MPSGAGYFINSNVLDGHCKWPVGFFCVALVFNAMPLIQKIILRLKPLDPPSYLHRGEMLVRSGIDRQLATLN